MIEDNQNTSTVSVDQRIVDNLPIDTTRPAPVDRDPIMQFFAYAHLPPKLGVVSQPFGELAEWVHANIVRNPERSVGLRKLLEAKDAIVRASIAK